MKPCFFSALIFLLLCANAGAQSGSVRKDSIIKDSAFVPLADSVLKNDTAEIAAKSPAVMRFDTAVFKAHPYYSIKNPIPLIISKRDWQGKDAFFYACVSLLLFFALIRNSFNRYLKDLVKLFFRTSIRHRQVKEQLMQAPLPSLLLNVLFFISGGLFFNLVLQRFGWGHQFPFWMLFLYGVAGLAGIYLVKFITLKICGWLFKLSNATDAYIFIVFTTNKIIGIALLPVIVLLTFTQGRFNTAVLNLSFLLIGLLFFYRFYLSYVSIQRQLSVQLFHFALYLCAFELIPLLLINKLLFQFLGINA